GADRAPWDTAYDALGDSLFVAATDGTLLIYDDFSTDQGASGPSRTALPALDGTQISINLHGIAYLPEQDVLVLSDVGDAAIADDGQLFTIAEASTAEGIVD